MRFSRMIIALGGGGFTHNQDPELDMLCLSYAQHSFSAKSKLASDTPKIGFIGMASNNDLLKIKRFYNRFTGEAQCRHLPADISYADAQSWCSDLDLIYVGGGNTKNLIAAMQQSGLDKLLLSAYDAGTVLAGVSAGAGCWFSDILSDSGGFGLAPLSGLGWIKASLCPHYSQEPDRKSAFESAIISGALPSGYAIDDGACLIVENSHVLGYVSARKGAAAYFVSQSSTSSQTNVIDEFTPT